MGDLFSLDITRAYLGYTCRFVVGRGRWWSLGCGLHTNEVLRKTEYSVRLREDFASTRPARPGRREGLHTRIGVF